METDKLFNDAVRTLSDYEKRYHPRIYHSANFVQDRMNRAKAKDAYSLSTPNRLRAKVQGREKIHLCFISV